MGKKLDNFVKIVVGNKEYAVCTLPYNMHNVPVILDMHIYNAIQQFDKLWNINDNSMVVCKHISNGITKEICLHDIVMKIMNNKNPSNKNILHINKLGIDNRYENLMFDCTDKDILKNSRKKARTIVFDKNVGINPDEIPSYVWYVKGDNSHGERFMIDIGDVQWKSTSSKEVSLRFKLEEVKKYLRHLMNVRKDLFDDYSMNGDLNDDGKKLLKSFLTISNLAGFKNLHDVSEMKKTNDYISENLNGLSKEEITLLNMFDPSQGRLNFK